MEALLKLIPWPVSVHLENFQNEHNFFPFFEKKRIENPLKFSLRNEEEGLLSEGLSVFAKWKFKFFLENYIFSTTNPLCLHVAGYGLLIFWKTFK